MIDRITTKSAATIMTNIMMDIMTNIMMNIMGGVIFGWATMITPSTATITANQPVRNVEFAAPTLVRRI